MIYHILTADDWERARTSRFYTPAAFEQEGFIHLCEAGQLAEVGNRYFRGQRDLVVLWVEPEALTAELRYENLVGGEELFPHLYGPLNLEAVRGVVPITQPY